MIDQVRLARILGVPERSRLLDRLVMRLERDEPLQGVLRLTNLTDDERDSYSRLLGRSRPVGPSLTIDLGTLERVIVESGAAESLVTAVEALRGPIRNRAADSYRALELRESAALPLRKVAESRPEYAVGVNAVLARGGLARVSRDLEHAAVMAERAARVLRALPVSGEGLAVFAARVLGSAHALDVGTPESTLVLAILGGGAAPLSGRAARRDRWSAHGVLVDELSSTVLIHRLPLPGPLGELSAHGEPVILTLRQVRHLVVPRLAEVFVCENPAVVEAAARDLGTACAPLVCVQGQPSAAAILLLGQLSPSAIRYHGDFDWGGLRVANTLFERVGFDPWRFTAADVEAYGDVPGEPLRSGGVDALWDPALRGALERRARRLEEEQVLAELLDDLAR